MVKPSLSMIRGLTTDAVKLADLSLEAKPKSGVTSIVDASDSKATHRGDYACDGTADEAEIETAIGALPT